MLAVVPDFHRLVSYSLTVIKFHIKEMSFFVLLNVYISTYII